MIGHSELGLRSGIRRMVELEQESGCRKHTFIEIEGWRSLGSWVNLGGGVYATTWDSAWATFNGRKLDATTVYSELETLTRKLTQAEVIATAGTYHLDFNNPADLTVHLTGGTNPATLEMFATTTHYIWNGSKNTPWLAIQPILGPSILVDGGLNVWSSPTALTNWGKTLTGAGHQLNQVVPLSEGTFAASFDSSGIGGGSVTIDQAVNLVRIGQQWRLSGVYRANRASTLAVPGTLSVNVGAADGIAPDGRNTQAGTAGNPIIKHLGSIRRFLFDFAAHEVSSTIRLSMSTPSATNVNAQFDDLRLQPIYGWSFSSPRLGQNTTWEESFADVYPGTRTTGIGSVECVNDDSAYFERMLSPASADGWTFEGRAVRVRCGGQFHDLSEIVYEDMLPAYQGRITRVEVGDITSALRLEEEQSVLETELPLRTYTVDDFPDGDPRIFNRRRPMLYGTKSNITPARIDFNATTLFGEYEYVDCDDTPDGVVGLTAMYAYLDEDAAGRKDTTKRVQLVAGKDYTDSPTTGRFVLLADVRVIEITAANNILNFNIGAGALKVSITPGVYLIGYGGATAADRRGLCEALRAGLVAAGAPGTIQVDYGTGGAPARKVRIDLAGKGTLNLLWESGLDKHVSIGPTLGYRGDADDTGAAAYDADDPLFVSADTSELLRATATGYKDTAGGTYTGTGSATIQKGTDMAQHTWRVFMKQPAVDTASFVAMRTSKPEVLAAYLGALAAINGGASGSVLAGAFFATIANSNGAQFQFDGAGTIYYTARASAAPSDAIIVPQTHYREFTGYYDVGETYGTVRLNYDQDPTTGFVLGVESTRKRTVLGNRRQNTQTWDSYHTTEANATAALVFFAAQARTSQRHFPILIQGMALRTKLGDWVKLTRDQALQGAGETGGLNQAAFRVKSKTTSTDHSVRLLVHTSVIT